MTPAISIPRLEAGAWSRPRLAHSAAYSLTTASDGDILLAGSYQNADGSGGVALASYTTDSTWSGGWGPEVLEAPADPLPEGTPVTMQAGLVVADGQTAGYAWTASDSSGTTIDSGSGAQYTFTLPDAGIYTITLAATIGGVTNTDVVTVTGTEVPPTWTSSNVPNATVNVGQTYNLPAVTFHDAGVGSSETATVAWGDGTTTDSEVDKAPTNPSDPTQGLDGTIFDSHAYTTPGTYTATLTLTDDAGESISQTFNVSVGAINVAITGLPSAGTMPYGSSVTLGSSVTNGSGSPLSPSGYSWTVTDAEGDTVDTGTGSSYTFTPPDVGTYTISLAATVNSATGTDSETMTVPDIAPTVSVSGPTTGTAGTEVDLTASVTSSSPLETAMGFTYDWTVTKNGNDFTWGGGPDISFTPDGVATYQLSVVATNFNGVQGDPVTQNFSVTADSLSINNVSCSTNVYKGGIATVQGDVSGLNGAGFMVGVTWGQNQGNGDTVTYPPTATSFSLSHLYLDTASSPFVGTYPVTVTVTPADGRAPVVDDEYIQGLDAAPSVNVACSVPYISAGTVGTPVTLTAYVADPGQNETSYTYTWEVWPSGGTDPGPVVNNSNTYTFTPTQQATYNWRLWVTDVQRRYELPRRQHRNHRRQRR